MSDNLAASVRARLLNYSRETRQDFNQVLTRYAIERFLYRIGVSPYADSFMLKGALLFDLWFDIPHRATRDADLLGFGSAELSGIEAIFQELCRIEYPDGMIFRPESVKVDEIRKEARYDGVRVLLFGFLDGARCLVQVDIGFGDAVTPEAEDVQYPVILKDFEQPKMRAYPRYTVVAEKFDAVYSLGMANSRMKDYFDLYTLARYMDFNGATLGRAVKATFERRRTVVVDAAPIGLTDTFAEDFQKQTQWQAFLRKNGIESVSLGEVVAVLSDFLLPVANTVLHGEVFSHEWKAGGPWS
ncbi:MAG: nucleotidyl transferase AbiEii/AbiGii toxin family protein [Treponema sp.]|nr:MAG: nucleotidyl transferase AbiEii/AbiGii toxin family protein [Treponema sp.]